jgi:hypothetical protein
MRCFNTSAGCPRTERLSQCTSEYRGRVITRIWKRAGIYRGLALFETCKSEYWRTPIEEKKGTAAAKDRLRARVRREWLVTHCLKNVLFAPSAASWNALRHFMIKPMTLPGLADDKPRILLKSFQSPICPTRIRDVIPLWLTDLDCIHMWPSMIYPALVFLHGYKRIVRLIRKYRIGCL